MPLPLRSFRSEIARPHGKAARVLRVPGPFGRPAPRAVRVLRVPGPSDALRRVSSFPSCVRFQCVIKSHPLPEPSSPKTSSPRQADLVGRTKLAKPLRSLRSLCVLCVKTSRTPFSNAKFAKNSDAKDAKILCGLCVLCGRNRHISLQDLEIGKFFV